MGRVPPDPAARRSADPAVEAEQRRSAELAKEAQEVFDDEAARDFENSGDFPDGN